MEQLHIPVRVQKMSKSKREPVGTCYFTEGTTANDVCVHITKRQQYKSGLWLLQMKVKDSPAYIGQGQGRRLSLNSSGECVDGGNYVTVKDSKYMLQDGTEYVVVHYSGMDIELTI